MINLSFEEIGATLLGLDIGPNDLQGKHPSDIYFDSRRITKGDNAIFIAIKTASQDGHAFIEEAYKKGIRNFIVNENSSYPYFEDMNIWAVSDPLASLHELAKLSRTKFKGLMVGITGSNGKTIVKEWMYQLLAGEMNIWRSPRSYNSQLGVALSLLKLNVRSLVAFVETGISKPGEMEILHELVQPHMSVFTHLGDAHNDTFENTEEKIAEKAKLFKDVDMAVLADGIPKSAILKYQKDNPLMKVITWSRSDKASYVLQSQKETDDGLELTILHKTQTFTFVIPFKDKASISNAMTCLCCLSALEQLGKASLARFKHLQKIENRLVSTQGKKNNLIINDSYSNDLSAFEIALDYLNTQSTNKSKVLIFSDFDIKPELIEANISNLKSILNSQHIDTIIAIGPWLGQNKANLPKGISFFENRHELIKDGMLQSIQNAAILIKGARKFELEKLSKMLEREVHQTQLRINLTAIKNNVKYYQSLLQPNTKTMAMVKALGYGTGGHEIAKALQSTGINYLGVAFAREAQELRENGIDLPIMVLNASLDEIMAYQELKLEPVVYNIQQIKDLKENSAIGELGIHIELDSGMHRLGFDEEDFQSILDLLPPRFKVKSIFSHLASSENSANDDFTNKQTSKLEAFASKLSKGLGYKPLIHLANTAGTQRHPTTHFDMVRLGIGMYGIPSVNEKLDTAVSLVSQITQIKTVPANEGIGYGLRNPSNKNRQIAIIPIGYADGLMRILNNEGKNGMVFINGEFAPIVGNICMDMTMIDVTDLDVYEGDEVELFGKHISIQSVAEKCETIPYEILTRISVRVKRIYTEK